MKKILGLTMIALFLFGCNKDYVQVFNTNSSIETDKEGFYIYENDSVKIIYSFWEAKGLMTFSIFNKLNKPLYIDWRKSSYIDNSVKLNYWTDKEETKTISNYKNYVYTGPLLKPAYATSNTSGSTVSSTVKAERITFIPPTSFYYRSQFYILPISYFKLFPKTNFENVARKDRPKKTTKIYKADYTKESSPLIFRNFLTFSTTEDFKTEFYVDNEFYVEEILEMDKTHFEYARYDETEKKMKFIRDENGRVILFSDFKTPSSFYLRFRK